MEVLPQPDIVYLEFLKAEAGVLDTSSRQSAVEYATVIAVGSNVTTVSCGDHVFVKSWSVDIVTHGEETYRFVNIKTNGILAVVRQHKGIS